MKIKSSAKLKFKNFGPRISIPILSFSKKLSMVEKEEGDYDREVKYVFAVTSIFILSDAELF